MTMAHPTCCRSIILMVAKDGKTMIILEEKIDGANLGISLTDAWYAGSREF